MRTPRPLIRTATATAAAALALAALAGPAHAAPTAAAAPADFDLCKTVEDVPVVGNALCSLVPSQASAGAPSPEDG
ncbi:hypothetical protein SMC26_08010 [Actinomadura fulvescens]|uniref:Uncharacterized protein n=1 Tax=Actinomadura fulvescens TaxID=46160 RepID=A0ABP6DB49_9ACTN